MSDAHWSQMMMPGERICQLENVNAELGIEVRTLRQKFEQAEARVAEFYKAGAELHGAILTNHRWFELRDDRLTDAMEGWLETTDEYHKECLRAKAEEQEKGGGDHA
ncbi:hypothetical protein [Marinobacter adhaerens]|uniref:hypothetical protein n=1 Tax=Marinobacter adhaerens TaxID=1033846 RepID=UPI003BA89F55